MIKWLLAFLPILLLAPAPYHRILFVGNSLTIARPADRLGWPGLNGMAASQPDRDYAHRVQLGLSAYQGAIPEMDIVSADIHRFIAGQVTGRTLFNEIPAPEVGADLVIVQMGDNAPPGTPYKVWADAYAEIATWAPGARYIALGKWGGPLGGQDERFLQQAAAAAGMEYIYIRDLHTPENVASQFANTAVAWHPNDAGMARIADRVLTALRPPMWLPWVTTGPTGGTIPGGTIPP